MRCGGSDARVVSRLCSMSAFDRSDHCSRHNRNALATTDPAHAFVAFALDRNVLLADAQRGRNALPHRLRIRTNARRFADHRDIDVDDLVAARFQQCREFGVAGAVIEGKCRTTNLPWELDEKVLARAIGAPRVKLLNDLEAAAYGMLHLQPDELCVLNPGARPKRQGNVAVVAAGTGLGEAMLYWDGQHHHPLASEGGHADFAPRKN